MHRLGVFLKARYAPSFPPNGHIRPRDVYVRSSAVERCLETAQLLTAGLCSPQGAWKWSEGTGVTLGTIWQPVPIHTISPPEADGLLVPTSTCKRAYALYGRVTESEVVKKFMEPFGEVMSSVTDVTGVRVTHIREARNVYDSLLSARHHLKEEVLPNFPVIFQVFLGFLNSN